VHNTRGLIFDRNHEGDYNITTNTNLVANLFIRKQSSFTENKIYPFATINELRPEIIQKARQMAVNRQPGHPWESMTDMQLLQSVQLYQKDYASGQEGLTLAAILLFGRDEVILSVLPFHKTDAICRIVNKDRYDDRDDVRTNLIESYDRLMRFVENHIPDKFVLKDDIRINVRNLIFREVIANTLIHREYTNPFPAKLIIEAGMVHTENANKAHGMEQLTPQRFTPYPKNPVIARVFKEIGRADELGSGVRNIFEYYKFYSEQKPRL
jgi:ATP-dependent DNA helicase RecG